MESKTVHVQGLTDQEAADHVRQALQEVWGIRAVEEVSLARGEVRFTYDEQAASFGDFRQALAECGFSIIGGVNDGTHL